MNSHFPSGSPASARRRAGRWVVTIVWAGLIFYLSTAGFGSSFTERLLRLLLRTLHVGVSPAVFATLHFAVRKAAHLTEYCIFGLLTYASLTQTEDFTWRGRSAVWSVVIAGLYSLTDEFHQSFVPGRTAALHDCVIDTAGALLGMAGVYGWDRLRGTMARRNDALEQPAETAPRGSRRSAGSSVQ